MQNPAHFVMIECETPFRVDHIPPSHRTGAPLQLIVQRKKGGMSRDMSPPCGVERLTYACAFSKPSMNWTSFSTPAFGMAL